ncbi:MAG: imidazole glycerol phosphate synthase subunit HisF [Flavobacteria bacterium RIFCSPLOWO2_12_FULL_35_11]|nr:MAG: imidazole glycerol phosphate synthase subunit HisF [Flavobacteria bacterium RIFCSPLOWO2_12_FULL_35_11]
MLKKRLIATLLTRNGRIVQSVNFRHTNVIGNAFTAVDFFNTWAVDEIVILDVSLNKNFREKFYEMIQGLSRRCFVPLTVGGWVTSIEDIRTLLKTGADKVVVNTEAVKNPGFVTDAARIFGSQCIVISIDVKLDTNNVYKVYIDRGKEATSLSSEEWAKKVQELGAGEIYLTSIDRDGLLQGYDLQLLQSVTSVVNIPVIASGGVGHWQHLVDGINIGNTDAVSAANIFHYTEHSTKNAKEFLHKAGVDARETVFYKVTQPRRPVYEIDYRV